MNEDWLEVLDEYGVEFLALDLHSDSDLVRFFRSQPGWAVDFEDEEAVLFVRAASKIRNPPLTSTNRLTEPVGIFWRVSP